MRRFGVHRARAARAASAARAHGRWGARGGAGGRGHAALAVARSVAAALAWAKSRVRVGTEAIAAPRRILKTTLGRVGYFEDDRASGVPVVFLGARAATARALFEDLRSARPVVAFDFPDARADLVGATREELVRVTVELLADVAVRYGASADVVASGPNGELAARALARTPQVARSLTLVAPLVELGATGGSRLRRLVDRAAPLDEPSGVIDVYDVVHVPLCFVHGGAAGWAGDASPFARAVDALAARHPGLRRTRVRAGAGGALDPIAVADALRAFFAALTPRPHLRVVRGGRPLGAPRGHGPGAGQGHAYGRGVAGGHLRRVKP